VHSAAVFRNWSRSIGELARVSPVNPIWFRWTGYMIAVTPILIWLVVRKWRAAFVAAKTSTGENHLRPTAPLLLCVLLIATYVLTIWQARWAYFFLSTFAIALPFLLESIESRIAVWIAFVLSIVPILSDWDARFWPNDSEYARRMEKRSESVQLRDLALNLKSSEAHPFLAPWWISPSVAYWSGQPGVAGSSHESLDGIVDSARFFLAEDWTTARNILGNRQATWVLAYDSERVTENSAAVLGVTATRQTLCAVLDKTPAQVPRFLLFSAQNAVAKLYRVGNNR
jgi:hypothetical protein